MKVAGYLLVTLFVALSLVSDVNAAWFRIRRNYPITATGTVKCYIDGSYQPMAHVLVKLIENEPIGNQFIASTRADSGGRFTVSGTARELFGEPDPKIRVDYDYEGTYGRMKVQDQLRITRRYRSGVRRYARNIDFGDINISDEHCRAYMRFYAAMEDFNSRAQTSLPYDCLFVSTNAVFASWFNAVYATLDRIRIQRDEDLSLATAKHELAHTVRHSYDGDNGHFSWDVARYGYARSHSCGTEANYGYAFNEGWAEFWAGDCYVRNNLCYWTPTLSAFDRLISSIRVALGLSPVDPCDYKYKIEGNVANALRKLQSDCSTSDADMVAVLRRSGRHSIHSFDQFNSKHYDLYSCRI